MKSDIEIARSIELIKIKELARSYNMPEDHVTHYGRHMAKVDISLIDKRTPPPSPDHVARQSPES